MPLVFLPDAETLFLWGGERDVAPRELPGFGEGGTARLAPLVTPEGPRDVHGTALPLLETVALLAAVPASAHESLPASFATWTLASKLALELVARERVIPTIARRGGRVEARWAAALSASDDADNVAALARSMPLSAYAVPVATGAELDVWAPDALLRAYLDSVVDALLRTSRGGPELPRAAAKGRKAANDVVASRAGGAAPSSWDERFRAALESADPSFTVHGFTERSVVDALERWTAPALGAPDRVRACFRLELPEGDREPFVLRFLLQSPEDRSLLVPASDVWAATANDLEKLGRAFRNAEEALLEALGRAARLFTPIERALGEAKPVLVELHPATAWEFLGDGAAALSDAGFGIIVPGELTVSGRRRLRLRARVGGKTAKVAGAVSGAAGLGLDELLTMDWEAIIGDDTLTPRELAALASQKAPLVRYRGAWVAIDPAELDDIQQHLARGPGRISVREALQMALAGEAREGTLSASVTATGSLAELLSQLKGGRESSLGAPAALNATLRPYQERGLSWLTSMASLGLGACLADDMGLGKTIQLIAFLLRRLETTPNDARPALLVAPMSVVGNWERELERFAPSLVVTQHYGTTRARTVTEFPVRPGSVVLTTYGLLRRDAELLAGVDWSLVALDEAQNIKNAASSTARAARGLPADHRFALTGTPVENRLAELWSISEFANPGLLGPLERFRREFAVPIERYDNEEAAARLQRVVGPFILRRLKSDSSIIQDLPAKNEMKVVCTLTREQATLYKAVVDEELRRIASAEGMERRGRVLALLTFTKQICNHPAQYLSERGPLAGRSGKLERVTEMLEEALAAGDKALVFTQFREMGERLEAHFAEQLGSEVMFLHGGTSKRARDEMVRRFQEEPHGPRLFVLSVKAGGTGLNLTAASHVFHYDRWWNPAVEDQATDRAYRIGQKRAVQVHKLLCAGTVEEKIDALLEKKRALASKVVGKGEQWITELGTAELRELFALSQGAVASADDTSEGESPARAPRRERKARKPPAEVRS